MKNFIQIPKRKISKQDSIICAFCLFFLAVLFGFLVILGFVSDSKIWQGDVKSIEISVEKFLKDGEKTGDLVDSDGNKYYIEYYLPETDWKALEGKTITIILPADSNRTILGVVVEENVLIDYEQTIKSMKVKESAIFGSFIPLVLLSIAGGVLCLAWIRKPPKTLTFATEDYVWERFCRILPKSSKKQKFEKLINVLYLFDCALLLLGGIVACVIMIDKVSFIYFGTVGGLIVLTFATNLIVDCCLLPKTEMKFIKENYPYYGNCIFIEPFVGTRKSHMIEVMGKMRKSEPDGFYDLANEFDAIFKEDGLFLFLPDKKNRLEAQTQGVFEEFDDLNVKKWIFQCTIPYDKLNFVAVPKYRKFSNMFGVIIKSRIEDCEVIPSEMNYDVHFAFDKDLEKTLKNLNVEVENLDYILNNIETLMKENCKNAKRVKGISPWYALRKK